MLQSRMIKNDYHHGNLKEEFLRLAFDFIAKEEIENLTLKVLSDATGTSRSAIYRHFASKDALIETMIEAGFVRFDEAISPLLNKSTEPLIERFYKSGKAYIEFAKTHPNLYRLLFGKKYAHIREKIISIHDEDCSGLVAVKKAVEEGQKSGVLKQEESFERAVLIWSSLHGLASLAIDGFMDIDTIVDKLYDTMFQDILVATLSSKTKLLAALPFGDTFITPKK